MSTFLHLFTHSSLSLVVFFPALAVLPLILVIVTNFLMSLIVLPRVDFSFLAKYQHEK